MPYIESSVNEFLEIANESITARKRSVSSLLDEAERKYRKKLKTPGDCEDQLLIIKNEARKFNECIDTLNKNKKDYDEGKIDKHTFDNTVSAATYLLKKNCQTLQIKLGNVVRDVDAVTAREIADFKEYIEGLIEIVKSIKRQMNLAYESAALEEFDLGDLDEDFNKKKDNDKDDDKKKDKDDEDDDSDDEDDEKDKKKKKSKSKDKDDDDSDDDDEDGDKKDKKKKKSSDDDDDDDSDDDEDDSDDEDDEKDKKKKKKSSDDDEDDDEDDDSDDDEDDDDDDKKDKKKKKKSSNDDFDLDEIDKELDKAKEAAEFNDSIEATALELMSEYDYDFSEAYEMACNINIAYEAALIDPDAAEMEIAYAEAMEGLRMSQKLGTVGSAVAVGTALGSVAGLTAGIIVSRLVKKSDKRAWRKASADYTKLSSEAEKIKAANKLAALLRNPEVVKSLNGDFSAVHPDVIKIYNEKSKRIASNSKMGVSTAVAPNPEDKKRYNRYAKLASRYGFKSPEALYNAAKASGIIIA